MQNYQTKQKTATKRQTKDAQATDYGLRTTDYGVRTLGVRSKDQARKYAKQLEDSWRSKSRRKVWITRGKCEWAEGAFHSRPKENPG